MTEPSIGVAVIGAGMAGRAHANGYRAAGTVYDTARPAARLVAIADTHEPFAADTARRYGYARAETSWQAVAEAGDVDAVSVVVANPLHREIVEGLLAAGKHVLCEKPLAPSVDDAQAMVDAAAAHPGQVAAVGFTFRRSPAINAIRQEVERTLGPVRHVVGNYWTDYGHDPGRPMSWRYLGGPGSGVLADIGSHMIDLAEFFCGPTTGVQGTTMSTVVTSRRKPLGVAVGHKGGVALSDERVPVENEDLCTFTTTYGGGAAGTFSLSRIAYGHANTLRLELFCERGTASFDLTRPGEFTVVDGAAPGIRRICVGPEHPYVAGGLPMDFPTVGHGQNDFFVFQARAFLDQIAGVGDLPPVPSLAHGLHNLRVLDAVVAATDKPVTL
ncbi:Gfo/Idh/MocA family protein [Spirilliplanes yamanashiensis]|uniref:Dehydrogenase n=1 Tax=Spirilliplanes yamanashiensis TaxID=42233 RepID=A0A8J3YAM2_9ACTN|nr:Gfo/Idh/MocA family oxidoreductase [Spirilliplanes yamanashiensis]MDP9817592.1 putative dehydrogenase [Spirilliplanes yamanashiensis]GIJ04402.1 dehydrogenase [Spirilliplanes yamanashiensis]